jgi:steroid delta-isomerase-like uncharacterized protein
VEEPAAPDHPNLLAVRLLKAWNSHDVARIGALYAPDYVGADVANPTRQCGPDGARRAARQYLSAFPDLRLVVAETFVLDGTVIAVWTASGSHRGPFMSIPPTGRHFAVRGMSLLGIHEDRIKRELRVWDVGGLLRAIGLLPDL